jgi:predicted alpha/beta superfamily hydrolase
LNDLLTHPTPSDQPSLFQPLPPALGSSSTLDDNPRYLVYPWFTSQYLPGHREISVYLPAAYFAEPNRRFPVFYLHDGQNLFDGRTSFIANRTWQANTTADRLTAAAEIEPILLVGIANTGVRRMAEYTPTRDPQRGGGEGDLYGRMLIQELKPLIDHNFRTLTDAPHTALGGSSLGGLISLALALDCPQVYGKAAILSPSLWWDNRSILNRLGPNFNSTHTQRPRLWLDMGTAEGLRHLRDTDLLHTRLLQRGWHDGFDLEYLRVNGGLHEESAWAARFDQVLRFLFPPLEG